MKFILPANLSLRVSYSLLAGTIVVLIFSFGLVLIDRAFAERALPKRLLLGNPVATDDRTTLQNDLAAFAHTFETRSLTIESAYASWEVTLKELGVTLDTEATRRIIAPHWETSSPLTRLALALKAFTAPPEEALRLRIDPGRLARFIAVTVRPSLPYAQDAHFTLGTQGNLSIESERTGVTVDLMWFSGILSDATVTSQNNVSLTLVRLAPLLTSAVLAEVKPEVETLIQKPLSVTMGKIRATISSPELLSWTQVTPPRATNLPATLSSLTAYDSAVGADDTLKDAARLTIASAALARSLTRLEVRIPDRARNPRVGLKDGKPFIIEPGKEGIGIDHAKAIPLITDAFFTKTNPVALPLTTVTPEITETTIATLPKLSLLATGETNFHGSPTNRRHNIRVGTATLHGVLIRPGETFSFLSELGEVSARTGYLPELVITKGTLVPEYGGGLCQVSSTAFIGALKTGLPIVERKNHSRIVSYYPTGMDATVYSPAPDLKFVNDTESYLLIQTRIEGEKVLFDFYGIPDGRTVELTKPVVFGYVAPGEPITIETPTLPVGTTKQQEKPVVGAQASFQRKVMRDGEILIEETFHSTYRPVREVILVGTGI
ncbi:MAG: VanW family protein [Parcubacteria group bacterium]|nr:VanW family protein [Parcubacteria group bacterium]